MANEASKPDPSDVADERGKVAPSEMPGHAVIAPDAGIDAPATHESSGITPSGRPIGTQGAMVEDLADPDADANRPDPSKPVSMSTGPRAQPDRGRDIPGDGYGDSRDVEGGDRAIDDEMDGLATGPGSRRAATLQRTTPRARRPGRTPGPITRASASRPMSTSHAPEAG